MSVSAALENQAGYDLADLRERYESLSGQDLLRPMVEEVFAGRIALVSSFGAESVVLLHLVAQIDQDIPVIFLNTGKLFGETLRYRDDLEKKLGLTNIISVKPDEEETKAEDSNGLLWSRDVDACCALRKVRPLARALEGYDAWITGRKRFQNELRQKLPGIEYADGRYKINPLIEWPRERIDTYIKEFKLPVHPLVADGFLSLGCMPCTRRVQKGEDPRAGRWAGIAKTECGIHMGEGI